MTLEHREVFGIAHLETRFYVLCRSPNLLVQYSDQSPFIKIKEIDIGGHVRLPQDLAASAVSNCLYVVDAATATAAAADDGCVWKVELGYPIRTTRWIADVSEPHTVSVNGRTGRVTTFGNRSRSLRVHGPKGDAAAAAAAVDVALPSEIEAPRHAVEASSGNFFVVCENPSRRHAGGGGGGVVCEVSVKGQILSRYEKLDCPVYLALDNDGDSVYVADNDGGRVQQLRGAGLKLQRTIPSDEDGGGRSGHGDDEELLERPFRLCFSSSSKGQRRLLVEHRNNNLTIFNLS